MKTAIQAVGASLIGLVLFGLLLFLPARSFDYWQAWVFIAAFAISTTVLTIYLLLKNPAVLEGRMHAGPAAESRAAQKFASSVLFTAIAAVLVFSAFDHRFGWSAVPTVITLVGDALVVIGLGIGSLVVLQNGYASANIRVEADQKVVSTGLYGLVRHPMYCGSLIFMVGTPLALGSYWGLLGVIPVASILAFRILDEEKMLREELTGYGAYTGEVKYRLVPHVW
jgi:protein-S-isoprenylcysteine O-methyltransferase Ste14